MNKKPNAIYIAGGGGTTVISASAYGVINQTFNEYQDKIETFYAAIGGMRGAINEDITDVFRWANEEGKENVKSRLNRIKFPSYPVFGTSRHNPNEEDCKRLLEIFKAHNIKYGFFNGGNDTMEKAIVMTNYAKQQGYELQIIGIPKTVDNDLRITHRCPGYASFAKQVAIDTMSLDGDLNSFSIKPYSTKGNKIKEGAVAQVVVYMGRDEGWGAASSIMGKIDESCGPHLILTKEGRFNMDKFLNRCQNQWDKYGKLMVVASEGVFDGTDYIGYYLDVKSQKYNVGFKVHQDSHKNTSVTDSRASLFLKLILEKELKIPTNVYKDFKCREEGPDYRNRNSLEIVSEIDFLDAINVGERAADLAFGNEKQSGVMVILTEVLGRTDYTPLNNVADPIKGSKAMTRSLSTLSQDGRPILTNDGMMVDRELYLNYAEKFIDLNGPNRSELLRGDGYLLPLKEIEWNLETKLLGPY